MCLGSILLCCAGAAIGQSVSHNASDVAGASVDASPESASVSSVDAIADSTVTAATRGGSGYRSGTGMGSFHAKMALAPGKSESEINPNRLSRLAAHQTATSDVLTRRAGTSTPNEREALAARVNGVPLLTGAKVPAAGVQGARIEIQNANTGVESTPADVEDAYSYSLDFPDSTNGTALLSPPDPGTQSSLDWSTDLDYSFPDFAQREFLMPSLHVGEPLGHTRQSKRDKLQSKPDKLRRAGAKSVNQSSASSMQNENKTIDTNILEPGILSQSPLNTNGLGQSPLNSSADRY